uniref:UDP-glycosyltransferase 82A1 n=1 Tax=Tanacetum cinerariifolium TaxID=118510 RepID=A0A6L2KWD4_TANCI|nr:UDP-glycosyltransferase 82A1 [Tanacetum cinerariifolium]
MNPKVIMVPYAAQGHVTPMLNLASTLSRLGLEPVVVTPEFIHQTVVNKTDVACISIPDGLDEDTPRDFFAIEFAMENNMPMHLDCLVRELNGEDGGGVAFMIVDLLASWALKVGDDCGVPVVGYWPVMFVAYQLIAAIPEMLSLGIISESGIPQNQGAVYLGHDQPPLSTQDLPWLIGNLAARKSRFRFWTRMLVRTRTLSQILVNTFPEEHQIELNLPNQEKHLNITPVGPLTQHTKYVNLKVSKEDTICLGWLDKQSERSVVYISFGTWVSPICKAKVRKLAISLELSKHPFIWVLGSKWCDGLPKGYVERLSSRGLVVPWAPQSEVLRHKAVGCYLTHCGWNSTIEAIQSKVKLLCYPIAGDQFVNCDYIVKIWRIGIRLNNLGEEVLHRSLKSVIDDIEMGQRLDKLNERVFGMETSSRVINKGCLSALKSLVKEHKGRSGIPSIRLNFDEEKHMNERPPILNEKGVGDADLKKPFKETLRTPLTWRIIEFAEPNYKMPTNIKLYDGTTDADDHLVVLHQ